MASVSVVGEGFVTAEVVLGEMISGGTTSASVVAGNGVAPVVAGHGAAPVAGGTGAAPVVLDPIADVEVVAAPVAAAGAGRAMRWTNNSSGFVLRRMAAMVSDGSRPDKVFKDKDVNQVAKALKEWCGKIVTPTQVYNHLRKWRQKWQKVIKLKDLSAALWDEHTNAIMLDNDHYLGHIKVANCIYFLYFIPSLSTCLNITMNLTA
jgi:hypothetical protein